MNHYTSFIEANRQMGSTTSLAEVAVEQDGYLVVHDHIMKKHVLRMNGRLRADRVFTMAEIRNGAHLGRESRQVFIDVACMCYINE